MSTISNKIVDDKRIAVEDFLPILKESETTYQAVSKVFVNQYVPIYTKKYLIYSVFDAAFSYDNGVCREDKVLSMVLKDVVKAILYTKLDLASKEEKYTDTVAKYDALSAYGFFDELDEYIDPSELEKIDRIIEIYREQRLEENTFANQFGKQVEHLNEVFEAFAEDLKDKFETVVANVDDNKLNKMAKIIDKLAANIKRG